MTSGREVGGLALSWPRSGGQGASGRKENLAINKLEIDVGVRCLTFSLTRTEARLGARPGPGLGTSLGSGYDGKPPGSGVSDPGSRDSSLVYCRCVRVCHPR